MMNKMKVDFNKDIVDLCMGETVVYDENGNRVQLYDIHPASRCEFVEYKNFSFEEMKKALEDVCGVEKDKDGCYIPKR